METSWSAGAGPHLAAAGGLRSKHSELVACLVDTCSDFQSHFRFFVNPMMSCLSEVSARVCWEVAQRVKLDGRAGRWARGPAAEGVAVTTKCCQVTYHT